jgi:hypothetical protein
MKKLCPTQRAARHRVRRAPVLTKTAEVYPSPGDAPSDSVGNPRLQRAPPPKQRTNLERFPPAPV